MKKSTEIRSLFYFAVIAFLFSATSMARAEEQSAFTESARERRYVGGPDESDLKVQANLAAAKNKPAATPESNEGF